MANTLSSPFHANRQPCHPEQQARSPSLALPHCPCPRFAPTGKVSPAATAGGQDAAVGGLRECLVYLLVTCWASWGSAVPMARNRILRLEAAATCSGLRESQASRLPASTRGVSASSRPDPSLLPSLTLACPQPSLPDPSLPCWSAPLADFIVGVRILRPITWGERLASSYHPGLRG